LYECFMLLRQTDRLETDENGILIWKAHPTMNEELSMVIEKDTDLER
jgi:hypothetical protein